MVDTDRLSHWLLCCAPYGCRMPTVHSWGKSSRTYTVDALCHILVAVNFSGWLTPALMHVFPTLCQPAWPSVELVVANKYGFSVTAEHWEWTLRTSAHWLCRLESVLAPLYVNPYRVGMLEGIWQAVFSVNDLCWFHVKSAIYQRL